MESVLTKTIASRGWHVYGKSTWMNPKAGQVVFAENEKSKEALTSDPYSVAWKRKSNKLTPDVIGHVPREISRFVHFFLIHGGTITAKVRTAQYYPSPIPNGGLEILLDVSFKIKEEDNRVLRRLKELMESNYEEPTINTPGTTEQLDLIHENSHDTLDTATTQRGTIVIIDDESESEEQQNGEDTN